MRQQHDPDIPISPEKFAPCDLRSAQWLAQSLQDRISQVRDILDNEKAASDRDAEIHLMLITVDCILGRILEGNTTDIGGVWK